MVIDGVPVESDLFDVSPENIESINVLKGTAAAALYGSRGKDGAILITTKLAKEDGLTVTAGLSSMVSAGFTVFPKLRQSLVRALMVSMPFGMEQMVVSRMET